MPKHSIQALVVKGKEILTTLSTNDKSEESLSLLVSYTEDEEKAVAGIIEDIYNKCGVVVKNTFKFIREAKPDTTTFLLEVDNNSEAGASGEVNKSNNNQISELKWVPIRNLINKGILTKYLILLYGECVDRNYEIECIEDLETIAGTDRNHGYGNYSLIRKRQLRTIKNIDKSADFSEKGVTILLSLILGIVFDYFFTEKSFGISVPIFVSALMAFFLWSVRKRVNFRKSIGWFLIVPILLLSLCFSIFSNRVLMSLNAILIPFLMIAASILIFIPELKWDSLAFINRVFERAVALSLENILKPFRFISEEVKVRSFNKMSTTKKSILKGLLVSIPLLLIIVPLLTSADMVFKYYISNLSEIFKFIDFGRTAFHVICTIAVAMYLFGYIWSFKYTYKNYEIRSLKPISWEPAAPLTVIFIINIVYLLFTIIQFSYLYGGNANSLPQGFTYAEYARKGFFELVTVTVINFAVLLTSMKFMRLEKKAVCYLSGILLTLLIFFTVSMLYSAHYKMSLYESSYGYTYLRVFVHYFMLLLLLLLLIALAGIWYKRFPMAKTMLVTSLVMYVILNYINVDAFIARKNIERYKEGRNIDISYLEGLSYDAIPYMKELLNDGDKYISEQIKRYVNNRMDILETDNSWSEFNYSKYKARNSIK